MTGMNTGLAQLALLLHGMGRGGFGNQFNLPSDPYSAAPQMPQPTVNNWAAMPMPSGHSSIGGGQGSVIPAQWAATAIPFELFGDLAGRTIEAPPYPQAMPIDIPPVFQPLPPYNPYWQIPNVEDHGTKLPPITIPQWPQNPPLLIPDAPGGETTLPPNSIPQLPYNPPFEIPDDSIDDDVNEYGEKPKKMSRRCQEEWAAADVECQKKLLEKYRRGDFDTPFDMDACKKGYVSVACGGQPLDWGPKGKPAPKPKGKPYKSFITA
jgi:hypothetical protein